MVIGFLFVSPFWLCVTIARRGVSIKMKQPRSASWATARSTSCFCAALLRVTKVVRSSSRGYIGNIVFCCLCCFLILSISAAPHLLVPPEGVPFGEIPAGEAASKSIEIRNASSSPVAVSQVKGCCGADAALSAMRIEPAAVVTLSVSLKAMLPGEFSKHIRILCDDPESPVINIPVTGTAVESKSASAASRWTLPTVVLAGIVDGFNPCSFAIMISLAGILAIGGPPARSSRICSWVSGSCRP